MRAGRIGAVVSLALVVSACGPRVPQDAGDASGEAVLLPTRIGSGPTTTLVEIPTTASTAATTTTAPPAPETIPVPSVDPNTDAPLRPEVDPGQLPGQAGAITDARVFLLGDAVLAATSATVSNQAANVLGPLGWRIVLDARSGRTPTEAIDVLRARRAEIGQVAVILVGNNQDGDLATWKRQLQTMLGLLAGVPKVVLFTLSESRPAVAALNDVIRDVGLQEPNRVVLVDWHRVSATTKGVLEKNKVDLTPLGAEVLARTIGTVLGPAPVAA
jgi:hypothetical protein